MCLPQNPFIWCAPKFVILKALFCNEITKILMDQETIFVINVIEQFSEVFPNRPL